jgi:3-oxoacyl-[acyl-carrier-protein] synthase III
MTCIAHDDIDAGRVHFRMDGKAVFDNGVARMSEAVVECLDANGLTLGDIDLHLIGEVQRLAIADRNRYVADPEFDAVPLEK